MAGLVVTPAQPNHPERIAMVGVMRLGVLGPTLGAGLALNQAETDRRPRRGVRPFG
jgi:hypothetical protein